MDGYFGCILIGLAVSVNIPKGFTWRGATALLLAVSGTYLVMINQWV